MKATLKIVISETLAVILLLLLAACRTQDDKDINTGIYKPEVNPTPKYFFTIEGNIDPTFNGQMHLFLKALYISTNLSCIYTYNRLEGASGERTMEVVYKIQPDMSGNYYYSIPLDHFKPGYCGWQLDSIDEKAGLGKQYADGNDFFDWVTIIIFDKKFESNKFDKTDIKDCDDEGCYIQNHSMPNKILSLRGNYTYKLYLRRKK